jgi:hypothetical protein
MKRGLLIILMSLLLIPAVTASLSVTGPSSAKYNVGDTIDISGYIQEDESFDGYLELSMACGSSTVYLPRKSLSLDANEMISFSQLSLPTITASSSMQGLCRIRAELTEGSVTVDGASSSTFQITDELEGTFSVDKSQIQLGNSITITGSIYKVDGTPLVGTAELYFDGDDGRYLIDFIDITSGTFAYAYDFTSGSAGTYDIDVIARDSYGNSQIFSDTDSFNVLDDLDVSIQTNEQSLYPGDVLNVFGDVTTALNSYVTSATVDISLDSATVSTSLSDSKYTQDIIIPEDITSGQHGITVSVKDIYGNEGSASTTINVKPLATSIDLVVSNTSFYPRDELTLSATLYDQADEVMQDSVALEVYDSLNRQVSAKSLLSEESITYQIPQFASPGQWTIKAYYEDPVTLGTSVAAQEFITIREVQKLDHSIDGNILSIRNVGNVPYTEDLEIQVAGMDEDYLIKKTKNLGVNETIKIDMTDELPTGTYTLSIPTGYGTVDESAFEITGGKSLSKLTWLYVALTVLFTVCLAYLIYAKIRSRKVNKKHLDEPGTKPAASKKPVKKIKLYDPKKDADKKKVSLTFEDKQQSMDDFKARTLEEIKRTEEKIGRDGRRANSIGEGKLGYITGRNDTAYKPKESSKDKPSVFSLFDE